MADEITVKPNITLVNGLLRAQYIPAAFKVDQQNARSYCEVKTVGTTEESWTSSDWPDVTEPGVVMLLNLDSTNFVQWGQSTGVYLGELTANDGSTTKGLPWAMFYGHSTTALYVKADTAACDVLVTVWDR